jgi:hypothetical protein
MSRNSIKIYILVDFKSWKTWTFYLLFPHLNQGCFHREEVEREGGVGEIRGVKGFFIFSCSPHAVANWFQSERENKNHPTIPSQTNQHTP